jgi:hypothetical protein
MHLFTLLVLTSIPSFGDRQHSRFWLNFRSSKHHYVIFNAQILHDLELMDLVRCEIISRRDRAI